MLLNTEPKEPLTTSPVVFAEYRVSVPCVPPEFISLGINECKSIPPVIGINCLRLVTPVEPSSALLILVVTNKSTLTVAAVCKLTWNCVVDTDVIVKFVFESAKIVFGVIPYRESLALSERTKQIILFNNKELDIVPEPGEKLKVSVPDAVTENNPPAVVPEYFFLAKKSISESVLALIASYGVSRIKLVLFGFEI